jgi:hypothetical protein
MDANYTNTRYPYNSQNPLEKLRQEMKIRKFSQKTIKSCLHYITEILNFARKTLIIQKYKHLVFFLF